VTSQRVPVLSRNQRSNVNKQLSSYNLLDDRLYHVKGDKRREVLIDEDRKRAVFAEAHSDQSSWTEYYNLQDLKCVRVGKHKERSVVPD